MTNLPRPHIPNHPLYILTSAAGVTCCAASQAALLREMTRLPHIAPVKVAHWVLPEVHNRMHDAPHGGWKRTEVFSWPDQPYKEVR